MKKGIFKVRPYIESQKRDFCIQNSDSRKRVLFLWGNGSDKA
jgi:hypothetical protein